jgi:GNAT superfamily N-acetyltransferase
MHVVSLIVVCPTEVCVVEGRCTGRKASTSETTRRAISCWRIRKPARWPAVPRPLAGCASPVGRLCLARWTREIRVIDIALIPAARGQGIGGALLRQIIDDGEQLSRR